jgi:hypothetical protein
MIDYDIDEFGGGKPEFDPRILEAGELQNTEWEPPNNLTIATVTNCEGDTIPLKIALNLLAYGEPCFEVDMDNPDWPLSIAKKTRAWKHLRNAVKNGTVELYGGGSAGERIAADILNGSNYVLVPGEDNSIEPDIEGLPDGDLAAIFNRGPRRQIHRVHVDKASLVAWLKSQVETPNLKRALEDARKTNNDQPLTQKAAEGIASRMGAKENQKETRAVLASVQGKQKPGPRGPRNASGKLRRQPDAI